MAVVWTSSGKKTANAQAVGTAPSQLASNVLWTEVEDPDDDDVTENGWPEGTIVYRVITP